MSEAESYGGGARVWQVRAMSGLSGKIVPRGAQFVASALCLEFAWCCMITFAAWGV